jgi:predicted nucleotidyltransferase
MLEYGEQETMDKRVARIISNLVELLVDRFGKELVAISLAGAIANGEETWINGKLASDIDLMVITKRNNPFLEKRIADFTNILISDPDYEIAVGCIPLKNLKKLKDLESFECKSSGKVLWGDKRLFDNVPIRRPEEIPKWEGIRLLLNRACELLRASRGETDKIYAIVKTYLAIGAAYLIFAGRYRCSYKERLCQIRNQCDLNFVRNFKQKYEQCSMFKLNQRTELKITFDEARIDLLDSIDFFLTKYTGRNRPINDNLDAISMQFNNPSHRFYFLLRQTLLGKTRIQMLLKEPCFTVWEEAINLLKENSLQLGRIENILQDWRIALQAFVY